MCIEESKEDEVEEHHFCGGTNSVKGHKGGERCCARKTVIHKSEIKSTISHRGVDNGKSTMKANGNGTM
jgi:hypothetical protein